MKDLVHQRRFVTRLILRSSITLCSLLMITGLIVFFMRSNILFPSDSGRKFYEIAKLSLPGGSAHGTNIFLTCSLLILLLTPIARVLNGIVASKRSNDNLYAIIGTIVMLLLITGLLVGQFADY